MLCELHDVFSSNMTELDRISIAARPQPHPFHPSPSHKDNTILKFEDNTTVIGCITGRGEVAYRREVAGLVSWCEDNNLTLNTDKTKEMIVDMRKKSRPPRPLYIQELEVEGVNSFKYLGISDALTWSLNTTQLLKRAQQRLYWGGWGSLACRLRSSVTSTAALLRASGLAVSPSGTAALLLWTANTCIER